VISDQPPFVGHGRFDAFQSLSLAVRALAQPASVQLTLFPDFVLKADELALEWEERYDFFLNSEESSMVNQAILEALQSLDDEIDQMSGEKRQDLWKDEALTNSIEWQRVRSLAKNVLRLAGWSEEPPEFSDRFYVGQ
jgi:uncharacterized protein Yka (UPF0111/DUF47 family)